jgi:protein MpaA
VGVGAAVLALTLASAGTAAEPHRETIGRSVEGRALVARAVGERDSGRRILVVGCIHGNECAGTRVTRRLVRSQAPAGSVLWVVHQLNPDGARRGSRLNAHGVDLNRNFPSEWRSGTPGTLEYGGPRALSEPEARAIRRLIRRVRPDVTIWFHQPQRTVRAWGPSRAAARRYATLARMRYRALRWPPGSAPNWQNHRWPGRASYVVELKAGPLAARRVARHAAAILRIARSR